MQSHEKLIQLYIKQISNDGNITFIDLKYTADNGTRNFLKTISEQPIIDDETEMLLKEEPIEITYLDEDECLQQSDIDEESTLSSSQDTNQSFRSITLEVRSMPSLFKCLLCSAKLHSELSLKRHLKFVHKSTTETCHTSTEQLEMDSAELEMLFANAKRLICDKCNRSFAKRSAFLKHYRYVHLKHLFRSKFKCPLCPRVFSGTGRIF